MLHLNNLLGVAKGLVRVKVALLDRVQALNECSWKLLIVIFYLLTFIIVTLQAFTIYTINILFKQSFEMPILHR